MMNDAVNDYYTEAKSWYQENYESIKYSRDRFQVLAISLGVLLGAAIVAIITIMPLKQYYYRMIEVNKNSGEVVVLKEMEGTKFSSNWMVNRYFINQYIQSRHSYSMEDIKRNFNQTIALSSKPIAGDYITSTVDSNPVSPIKVLNSQYYRDVKVISINQLNANTALARFRTFTNNKNNSSDIKIENWQAVVKWTYANPQDSLEERDKNPLGFLVTYYQVAPVFPEN